VRGLRRRVAPLEAAAVAAAIAEPDPAAGEAARRWAIACLDLAVAARVRGRLTDKCNLAAMALFGAAVRGETAEDLPELLRAAAARHGAERVVGELAPLWAAWWAMPEDEAAAVVRDAVSAARAGEDAAVA
jgi:hypothetical protein